MFVVVVLRGSVLNAFGSYSVFWRVIPLSKCLLRVEVSSGPEISLSVA